MGGLASIKNGKLVKIPKERELSDTKHFFFNLANSKLPNLLSCL
jgi:hypothetical protein